MLWDIFSSPITEDEYSGKSIRILTDDVFEPQRCLMFMGVTAALEHMRRITPQSHRQTIDNVVYYGKRFALRKLHSMEQEDIKFILSERDRVCKKKKTVQGHPS
jgi:hypothetical protein